MASRCVNSADASSADALAHLDPALTRRAFARASRGYDAVAVLQQQVRDELLSRLALARVAPVTVLDVGAGTAHSSVALKKRYPKARVIALDSALSMLSQARRRFTLLRRFDRVCADGARLPLPEGSVDLLFCNLMLQWASPDPVLREFRRVLREDGVLALTSCGPDTLRELRAAWAEADNLPHVLPFIDMHDLGDALVRAGFAAPVLDVERYTLNYAGVREALVDLRANGSCNPLPQRRHALTGKARFAAMRARYEAAREAQRIPLSCEIVFAHARVGAHTRRAGSDTRVPLEQVVRQLPGRRR